MSEGKLKNFWKPLQQLVPKTIKSNLHNSKQFLEWFKQFNLDLAIKKQDKIEKLYNHLPDSLKCLLDNSKIYYIFNHTRELLQGIESTIYAPIRLPSKKEKIE